VIELSNEPGSGNLIICEILLMHIDEKILDANGIIDPDKIDLVARMGGNWYLRASGNAKFEIPKPIGTMGIGVDSIPQNIRNSKILTGNNLGALGNVEKLPAKDEVESFINSDIYKSFGELNSEEKKHSAAKQLLDKNKIADAWKVLLS